MAEVTVDKLRVEVKATAEGANKVFTQLAKQLETLKSASSFNTSGLTNLTNALNKVSTSLDTLSSKINTVNGKTVTPKINTDGVTSSQKKIDNSISKIRESLAGLTAYGNAAMSGDSSALTSFDRRVTSIQSAIDVLKTKIDSLGNTTVKVNAIDYYESKIEKAKDAIDQLVAKENEFKANGTDTGEAWDTLQAKLAETRDQLDALIQRQSEFSAGDMIDVDAFEDQKAALADFESQLHTTSDTVHNAVSTMNSQPVDIDTTPSQSNLSALAATLGSVSAQLLSVVGSTVISGFSKLSSAIKSVRNGISSLKSKVSGLSGTFNKGFFTILKYGFGIRSLYVLFRRLRQAVKDSFTELQNSGAYYETTRANIEALKSSLSILKYQFGAAFETIFNTVAPALQTFINYLISAMNTLSAFIAKLTGKSTYSKAVKATSDIAGNAGSAADSAKEMAKQLQGFDELNNLSGNSSGGSGGGGGSSGDSSGVTYVTESVDNALGSFTKALSDSINKGEWEKVGTLLSDKLTEMMNKIPWNDIYKKAENFGKDLADFLNGLITPKLFSALGKTISSSLNTALKFLNSFGKKFKWKNFGNSLATGLNTFFKNFEFDTLGDTIHTWIAGLLDAGIQLLKDTDFELIGEKLGEFIKSLKIKDLVNKCKNLAIQIVKAIGKAITGLKKSEVSSLELAIGAVLGTLVVTKSIPATLTIAAAIAGIELGTKFYEIQTGNKVEQSFIEEIGDILDGIIGETRVNINIAEVICFVWDELTGQNDKNATQFEKDLKQWLFLGLGVITGWTFPVVVSKLITFDWSNFSFESLKTKFVNKWNEFWNGTDLSSTGANGMPSAVADSLSSGGMKQKLEDFGKNIGEGIKEGFKSEVTAWTQPIKDMWTNFVNTLKDIFGINSPAKTMEPYGQYIFEGIVEGFKNAFTKLKEKIAELPGKVKEWIKEHFKNFSLTETLSGLIGSAGDIIMMGVELTKSGWSTISGWLNETAQKGKEAVEGLVGLAKSGWTKLNAWISNNAVEKKVEGLVALAKSGWTKLNAWISNNAVEKKVEGLVELAKSGWTKLNAWISANSIEKKVEGFVGLAKSGWTKLSAWVSQNAIEKKVEALVKLGKSGWETISQWVSKTSSTVWAYVKLWKDNWKSVLGFIFDTPNKIASAVTSTVWVGIKLWKDGWSSIKSFFGLSGGGIVGANGGLTLFANGGSITKTSSRVWSSIPQFAKGSLNAPKHGTMFVAGENGPEIMGHINGRTEILNRSQIAQTMNNAIVKGMAQFRNMQFNPALATPYSGYAYSSDFSDNSYRDNDTAIMEQNRLLAEQNRLLEQILQKPTGISKRDIFEANRSESNNYFNRTGNSPFLF